MIRYIRFTSIYEDGYKGERVEQIDIPDSVPPDEYEDFLFPYTGVGHPGYAGYFAESIDGAAPEIFLEWWG